jgi:hypothetical protein
MSIELALSNSSARYQPETIGSTSSSQLRMKGPAQPTSSVAGNRLKHTVPLRTTKTSQKLVLLPEEENIEDASDVEAPVFPFTPEPVEVQDSTEPERMTKEVRDDKNYPR